MKKNLFRNAVIAVFTLFSFISIAQPANDLCANATPLTLGNPCVNGTVVGANDNITSVAGCQAGGGVNQHLDVWYSFVATGNQFAATFTSAAPFTGNIEFLLVSGACGAQSIISSSCAASPLTVNVPGLTIGTTYYVIISKQGSGTAGPFTICNYNTTTSACTVNDDCFTAQNIVLNAVGAASVCTPGCNTGAAAGLDFAGNNCEDMLNPTVWYSFTTGATAASININLTSATMTNPEYTIFSNTSLCFGPYTILNCLEGTGGSAITTSLVVAPNTTYYIAVSDATADQGNFNLCIAQNPDNSACNTNNNLVVSATSMGSPLVGPYKPGEVVSFCYTITDWQMINCNYLGAVVPVFGDCWAASSFNAQGMPVSITTPLNVNGIIQTSAGGPQNPCAGTAAGSWVWFPAGAAQYNVAGGSLPVGAAMGAGWYFLSSYNPATGLCTGDPTDPDFTYGDGNYPNCGPNTFDYTLCFNLTAGAAGNCGTGFTDCGVSFKTYADGEFGAWNSIGCTADITTVTSATFECCAPPNVTSANTATVCSGNTVSIALTSSVTSTYSWIATDNTNVTGESTTAQTTSTLSNTLVNATAFAQTVIYTITPTSTTGCLGIPQTVTVTVDPLPTTVASTTGTLTCSVSSVTLNSTVAGINYTWTAPAGGSVGSANTQSTTASGVAGTYTLVAQNAAGCTYSTTTAVTQNTTAPAPTASNSTTLTCSNATVALTGGPASGVTYQWSGPGFSGSTTSQNATATAAGTYTLLVTSTTNGCTGTATTTVIQNTTAPAPTASNTTTLSCTTTTATLTGGPASGVTYQWSGPGFSGSTTSQNATATAVGTYTLLVTSTTNGCTGSATTAVTQNITPPAPTASNSTTLTCTTTTAALTGGPTSGVTYQWSGAGFSGSTTSQNAIATAPGTYTLLVTSTTNSCTATATTVVSQNTLAPTTVASTTGTLTCSTTTVALNSTLAGMNYTWTAPAGGSVTSANTQSTTVSGTAGTYTIRVVNPANGCSFTTTTSVIQNTIAPITVASTTGTLTCTVSVVSLNSTLAGMNYTWTAPAGGSVASANAQSTSASGAPGTYSLTVVNSANGCTYSTTTSVTQNTLAPTGVSAGTNQTLTCASASVTLTGSVATPTNATVNWTGASVCGSTSSLATSACGAGVYTITATSPSNGCTATSTVQVFPSAGAPAVSNNPVTNTITCTNTLVTVSISTTVTPVNITWAGTGISSGNGTATITVNQGGTFSYTVLNTSNGCSTANNQAVATNTAVPTSVANTTGTLTCSTTTVALNTSLSGMNYTWTAPAGGSVASTNTQSTTASGTAGTYTVRVVNPVNGCSYITTTTVTQNTVVPTTTASTTGTLTCTTSTVSLSSTLSGMNYTWTAPAGGSVTTANTQNTNATDVVAGIYSLTVLNPANGCAYSTTTSVTQNTVAPTGVSAGTNQTLTCASTSVALNASVTTPTNALLDWGTSVCGAQTTAATAACAAGVFTLTATDPSNGCIATSTVEVFPNAGAPTATISSTALVIDCNNASQSVTVTSTPNTDVTYTWNNTPSTVSTDGSVASFTTPNAYICTVTNTLSNCSTPIQVVVTTNTTVPTTTASASGMLTCVTTTVDLTSTLAGMNYTWTAPSGGSVTSANTQSTTASGAGDYTLTVTDPSNGCSYTTSLTVTQNTIAPTGVSAGSNQTLTCGSTSVTLSGSITTPTNATIGWTGVSVCGTATSLSSAACAAGVYTLTATDPSNGCVSTSTVDIAPNAGAPTVTISSTALVIDCNNATQSVTVTSTPNTDVTYTWNTPPATVSVNGDIATFNSPNTYICTVTNTLSNCSTPVQVIVTTNTTVPAISITGAQTLTCAAPTAVISTTVIPSTGITYTWTGTVVSGQGTGTITVNAADDYSVTVTAANGCTNTASSQIIPGVNVPTATIVATSSNSIITCQNSTVTLGANVAPTGTYSYTWSPSGNTGSATEMATTAGVYNVIVLNTATGCTATATAFTVTGNTTPPTVTTSNTTIPCGSPSVTIGANASNVSYSWSTSNGTILSGPGSSSPIAGSAGDYVVTVTDNTNGCTNTATVTVTSVAVTAAFTANPTSGSAPLLVNFTNQTPGTGNVYSWNFGDDNNNTSALTNPDHTYNTVGDYIVTLVVTNGGGCSATATIAINVYENSSIIVPNVFTPNGDGKNDVFRITTTGMKDLNCDIFNRWGTKVATISGVNGSWDGSNVNDGTFFYILTATGMDGTDYKQQGYINVFK
ncbi:MAG: PKD-like domain-containing protein [Bacteroidota bacterium]